MADIASAWEKFLVVPGLVINVTIAVLLLAAKVTHWTDSPEFTVLVQKDRTTVGIITQVISHLLGMLLTSTLCK